MEFKAVFFAKGSRIFPSFFTLSLLRFCRWITQGNEEKLDCQWLTHEPSKANETEEKKEHPKQRFHLSPSSIQQCKQNPVHISLSFIQNPIKNKPQTQKKGNKSYLLWFSTFLIKPQVEMKAQEAAEAKKCRRSTRREEERKREDLKFLWVLFIYFFVSTLFSLLFLGLIWEK